MIILLLIVGLYLTVGALSVRYSGTGDWLAMMSYNFPWQTLLLWLPLSIIAWPLQAPWRDWNWHKGDKRPH